MAGKIIELKAACLREYISFPHVDHPTLTRTATGQAKDVTGLQGRTLAVTLRQTSSAGEWYAALKDTGAKKYLKLWMNRNKTYPTQVEALQAYLVFVKKMKTDSRLFSMSPRATRSK